jgi:hypothetical protein
MLSCLNTSTTVTSILPLLTGSPFNTGVGVGGTFVEVGRCVEVGRNVEVEVGVTVWVASGEDVALGVALEALSILPLHPETNEALKTNESRTNI